MIPEHAGQIDPQLDATVDAIIRNNGSDPSRLLDVVQAIQRRYGFISNDAINAVAAGLHMHAVEVLDTVSFYAFSIELPKAFHIRLSRTPISLMKGAAEVAEAFATATGAPMGGTSPGKPFTIEWTSDIGMADQEPSALINATVVNSLHPSEVPAIVSLLLQHGDPSALPNAVVARPHRALPRDLLSGCKAWRWHPRCPCHVIGGRDPRNLCAKLRGRGGAGFRPHSNGSSAAKPKAMNIMWSAMPTKASPAPSKTAYCSPSCRIWFSTA